MSSITHRFILNESLREDNTRLVMLRHTYERRHRYTGTGVYLHEKLFNPKGDSVKLNWVRSTHPQSVVLNATLNGYYERALAANERLNKEAVPFTVEDVKAAIDPQPEACFSSLIEEAVVRYRAREQWAMASTRECVLNSLRAYMGLSETDPIAFSRLTRATIEKWETYMLTRPLPFNRRTSPAKRRNTANSYLSILRGFIIAYIVQNKLPDAANPMRDWRLQAESVEASALSEEEISQLLLLDLPIKEGRTVHTLRATRDFYCCSFGLQGIRVGDLVLARCEQLTVDVAGVCWFYYVSGKRNVAKRLRVDPPFSQMLIGWAKGKKPDQFIFPFINQLRYERRAPEAQYKSVKSTIGWLNRKFREVAALLGITRHLTLHSARHSFGDALMEATGDLSLVQDAFAHSELQTTQRYVARRKAGRVDRANVVYARYSEPEEEQHPTETLLKQY